MLAHKVDKEPITPEIIKSVMDRDATQQATLADKVFVLCWDSLDFFHYNELAKIKECDVQVLKTTLKY